MYDFAFDAKGLERELVRSDFGRGSSLVDDEVKKSVIASAVAIARNGFPKLEHQKSLARGKAVYQMTSLPQALVLRKLARNVRYLTRVKQSDRDTVIKSLKAILAEGHNYRAYKLDLRQFYESVLRSTIEDGFRRDAGLPSTTMLVFKSFSERLDDLSIGGLPRGLAVSATLSEYLMRRFDKTVRSLEPVHFYARYVDDIIIVTTGGEDRRTFLRKIRQLLPQGLTLNNAKCRTSDFVRPKVKAADATREDFVDFLGYRFTVFGQATTSDRTIRRRVDIDIAPRKVARFKSRIVLSLLKFSDDRKFADLIDRLKVLSGNYNLYDQGKKLRRNVGIYWNYRQIDRAQSTALPDLDSFLKRLLLSKEGRLVARVAPHLSDEQRKTILSLSFSKSFDDVTFYHFSFERLSDLVGCWAYA